MLLCYQLSFVKVVSVAFIKEIILFSFVLVTAHGDHSKVWQMTKLIKKCINEVFNASKIS